MIDLLILSNTSWTFGNFFSRVFTFGIGDGVSTSLVKGAAHAGKGKCVIVKDTKDLASQVGCDFLFNALIVYC